MAPSNTEGATGSSQRTWLHQDNEILGSGVLYTVKVSLAFLSSARA